MSDIKLSMIHGAVSIEGQLFAMHYGWNVTHTFVTDSPHTGLVRSTSGISGLKMDTWPGSGKILSRNFATGGKKCLVGQSAIGVLVVGSGHKLINTGGGGGTQIWFGQGCASRASKPYPSLTVILAEKAIVKDFS